MAVSGTVSGTSVHRDDDMAVWNLNLQTQADFREKSWRVAKTSDRRSITEASRVRTLLGPDWSRRRILRPPPKHSDENISSLLCVIIHSIQCGPPLPFLPHCDEDA